MTGIQAGGSSRRSRSLTRLRRDYRVSLPNSPAAAPLVLSRLSPPPPVPVHQNRQLRRLACSTPALNKHNLHSRPQSRLVPLAAGGWGRELTVAAGCMKTTLKQLYYRLIYPYINYGLMSWGNTYTTHLNKIRTAQNKMKCVKNIFFAQKRENATVYFNLLGILTIDNAFKLKVAIFTFKIINDQICPVFANSITTASSRHSYNTRFSSRQNFSRPKIRTNYGKHTFQFAASQIWAVIGYLLRLTAACIRCPGLYRDSACVVPNVLKRLFHIVSGKSLLSALDNHLSIRRLLRSPVGRKNCTMAKP